MHKLLARQIAKLLGTAEAIPEALQPLLAAVDEAYRQADEDRILLERSLDLTSQELLDRHEQLRRDNEALATGKRAREEAVSVLQATLESTADGLLVVDLAGRMVSYNRRFAEMWGIPEEILESRDDDRAIAFVCDQLVDAAAFVAQVRDLYSQPERESHDVIEFKDGRVFERYSRPQRVDERCVGRVWSFRDVTEQRRAEEALRLSEQRYRRLFEDDLTAIVLSRPEGGIDDCNPAFLRLFGFESKDQALAADMGELYLRAGDRQTLVEEVRRFSRVENFAIEARRLDGEVLHVVSSVSGRFDDAGRLVTLLCCFSNDTERRKLEEQLRLAQRMEAVGTLAGGIAHDFNNLLTAILGYSALVHDGLDPADPLRTEVAEISRAGARAADLTRQLLAFSRKQVLDRRPLQLNAVVREIERMLRRLIGEDIELVVGLDEGLGITEADVAQIEQVITNLVVNARDALPNGGTIAIETANVEVDLAYRKRHPVVPEGPYVRLSVADDGAGIDPVQLDRIFEPFFTTKEQGKGTGLGLSVVYGIVKQSDGFVWVYSEPGEGTTFKVYLPRCAQEDPLAVDDEEGQESGDLAGSESVLLVEDDSLVRGLASRILLRHGYRVLTAAHPEEAIALSRTTAEPIDLLLTDLVMPGMNGRDLARSIRAARPGIRIVYMSGHSESMVQSRGLVDGDGCYVPKPFSAATLLAKVRAALGP